MTKSIKFLQPSLIAEKANELLKKAKEEGFYDFNSPTPLDLIAESILELRIIFEAKLDKDLEGVIGLLDTQNKAIWLDNSLNHYETEEFCDEARCNFTIAHEIGHHALNHSSYAEGNLIAFHNELDRQTKKIETQANMFAAMLLMPYKLVERKWQEDFAHIKNKNERIAEMINFFRVSRESMQYRLRDLELL